MHHLARSFRFALSMLILSLAPTHAQVVSPRGLAVPESEGLWPNLAESPDGQLVLSWLVEREGGGHALRVADWKAGRFGPTRTVAVGTDWLVNWADFPVVSVGEGGQRLATWLRRLGDGHGYGIEHALSSDGGRSWRERGFLHVDRSEAEHGFPTLIPLRGGGFFTAWLDGRHWKESGMQLFSRRVGARGRLSEETSLDPRVCDCCQTTGLITDAGSLLLAYRDRSPEERRDISVLRARSSSARDWESPEGIFQDGWVVKGCPVNGPALDAEGGLVAMAWYSAPGGTGELKLILSRDGGASFGEPISVYQGRLMAEESASSMSVEKASFHQPLGRVDVVVRSDGTVVVSWLELEFDGGASWYVAALEPRAKTPGPAVKVGSAPEGRAAGFLRMAESGPRLLATFVGKQGLELVELR